VFSNKPHPIFPIDRQIIASTETANKRFRLDPSRYSGEGEAMLRQIKQLGIPSKRICDLDEFIEVYLPNRFTRVYIDSAEYGAQMLGTSSMFMTRLPTDSVIRLHDPDKISPLWIREGDILISRSGTIGKSVVCGKTYTNHIASDDCFRLRIHESMRGYVSAFLQTRIGLTLLTRVGHGKVIRHLKDHDITDTLIPFIEETSRDRINRVMLEAVANVDKARVSLQSAEDLISGILLKSEYAELNKSSVNMGNSFTHPAHLLSRFRLDSHFYSPPVSRLRSILSKMESKPLGQIADVWGVSRFKRYRADKGYGTPLFSSADVMRARLLPSANLSSARNAKSVNQCVVHEGTILISCSGAFGGILGRSILVSKYLGNKAITQHVVRVKVTDPEFDAHYVAAIVGSNRLGYPLITAYRYGKDVPEIDPDDLKTLPIPRAKPTDQESIASLVRSAYESLDRANELEDAAQQELTAALTL